MSKIWGTGHSVEAAWRKFNPKEHIKDFNTDEWKAMYDDHGNELQGIRGKAGAVGMKIDGTEIGVDLIEMQPGSAFPLHIHPGDHILYGISGSGYVHIDGTDHELNAESTIFIPAEYPHGVKTKPDATTPFILLAFGHPHKHVDATDRMTIVDKE